MAQNGEILDELKWQYDERIKQKTKESTNGTKPKNITLIRLESFLLSAEVLSSKNAKNKKKKIRNMLLTKNFLYFINEFNFCMINTFSIKRKIPVVKFEKITLCKEERNCLVHILDEDDIFLSAGDAKSDNDNSDNLKRFQRIVKELDKAYTN
jgi:hypothetical protein